MRLDYLYERVSRLELPNARVLQRWCSPASSLICCREDAVSSSGQGPPPTPGGTGVFCGPLGELPSQLFVTITGLDDSCNNGRRYATPIATLTDPVTPPIDYTYGTVNFAPFGNQSYRLKYGGRSYPSGAFNNVIPPGHFYYLDDSVPVPTGTANGVANVSFPFPAGEHPFLIVTRDPQSYDVACHQMNTPGLGPLPQFAQLLMSKTNITYDVPCDIDVVPGNLSEVVSMRRGYVDKYVGLSGFGPSWPLFNLFGVIPSLHVNDANVIAQFPYGVRHSIWKQIIGFISEECNGVSFAFESAIIRHETYKAPDANANEFVGVATMCQYENSGPFGFINLGNCDYTGGGGNASLAMQPNGELGGVGLISGMGGTVQLEVST